MKTKTITQLVVWAFLACTTMAAAQTNAVRSMSQISYKKNVRLETPAMKQVSLSSADAKVEKTLAQIKDIDLSANARAKTVLKATAGNDLLNGTLAIDAYDYFSGAPLSWNIEVRKDETDATKYWFKNLFPFKEGEGLTLYEVYATLSDNILSFPLNQVVMDITELGQFTLQGLEYVQGKGDVLMTTPIQAKVDEENGVIVFQNGFGANNEGFISCYDLNWTARVYTAETYPILTEIMLPQGAMFETMSQDLMNYPFLTVNIPGKTWEWNCLSNVKDFDAIEWQYAPADASSEADIITVTEPKLVMDVNAGDAFIAPILAVEKDNHYGMATIGYNSGYFEYGAIVEAGGATHVDDGQRFNWSNANFDYDLNFMMTVPGTNDLAYGFNGQKGKAKKETEALMVRYDAPADPLLFGGVDVLCLLSDPNNKSHFRMEIREVSMDAESFALGNLIAYSDKVNKYSGGVGDIATLQFSDFKTSDNKALDKVRVTTGFALILSGYYEDGVIFTAASENYQRPYNRSTTFYKVPGDEKNYYMHEDLSQALFFSLYDASFESGNTGIEPVETANTTKLYTTSDAFNFTYTDDFTSMDVYNMNGQKVSSYALPQTGTFSIAKSALNDGVYMFRMNGKTTEVLRAVK